MDLTIVITSKNRPEKLIRLIDYLEFIGFSGQLLIGDASPYEHSNEVKKRLESCFLEHRYVWHEGLPVAESHQVLAEMLRTTYSMCIADGGLIIVDGIKKSIEILEKDATLVAASGSTFLFRVDKKRRVSWLSRYPMPNIQSDTPITRLRQMCSEYRVPMYCVMRSSTWIDIWKQTNTIPEQSFASEIIPAMRLVLKGKITHHGAPYLLREIHIKRTKLIKGEHLSLLANFNQIIKKSTDLLFSEARSVDAQITKESLKVEFDVFLKNFMEPARESFALRSRFIVKLSTWLHKVAVFSRFSMRIRKKKYASQLNWNTIQRNSFDEALALVDKLNSQV